MFLIQRVGHALPHPSPSCTASALTMRDTLHGSYYADALLHVLTVSIPFAFRGMARGPLIPSGILAAYAVPCGGWTAGVSMG